MVHLDMGCKPNKRDPDVKQADQARYFTYRNHVTQLELESQNPDLPHYFSFPKLNGKSGFYCTNVVMLNL